MFGRQPLRGTIAKIYEAFEPCQITVWAMSNISENRSGSVVYLQKDPTLCTVADGTPVELATTINVTLMPGESLYGITENEGLVGFVVNLLM